MTVSVHYLAYNPSLFQPRLKSLTDSHTVLLLEVLIYIFGRRYQRCNHMFQIWWRSVQGFSVGRGSNFAIPHWLWRSSLQHSHTTMWACDSLLCEAVGLRSAILATAWLLVYFTVYLSVTVLSMFLSLRHRSHDSPGHKTSMWLMF